MSIEDRLRSALHDVADGTPVDPGSYDRIERKAAVARRRRRVVGSGVALALVAVGVAVPLALRDDSQSVQTGPASDSRDTTTTTDTTVGDEEPSGYAVADPPFAWPAPDDDRRYNEPAGAAADFAVRYLDMDRPFVEPIDGPDEGPTRFVLRPRREDGSTAPVDGPRTEVDVARVSFAGVEQYWAVVAAKSPNLVVAEPSQPGPVSSPVTVSGLARNLYEGNVIVEVRLGDGNVGREATTATGSGPELAAFSVDVPFEPTEGRGAIVVKSDSGIEGTPEATVVPVTFQPLQGAPTTAVTIYLLDERGDFVPVTREVPRTQGVLRAALRAQLDGATPEEEARGLSSPFTLDAELLRGVTITEGDRAVVDLDPSFGLRIPNSSTSTMSTAILGSLDRTVFQFPNVLWVSYRFGGECGTFGEIDPAFLCEPRTRDEY